MPISGLQAGENVTGIDFRPATGELFALTSTNRVLRIDPATGPGASRSGNPIDAALFAAGQPVGLDFNPTVDRLRLVNDADDNLRFNPVTFTPVDGDAATAGIQADTDLAYVAGDPASGQDPNVVAVGLRPQRQRPDDADDPVRHRLDAEHAGPPGRRGRQPAGVGGSPNGGLLFTIGALGVNPTDLAGFDIAGDGSAATAWRWPRCSSRARRSRGCSRSTWPRVQRPRSARRRRVGPGNGDCPAELPVQRADRLGHVRTTGWPWSR